MKNGLKELFKQIIPVKFGFLVTAYGFSLRQASQWHFVAQSPYCQVTMEIDRGRFGCWLERRDIETFPYHPVDVIVLAMCLGCQPQETLRFASEEEVFMQDVELYVIALQDYCSEFLEGNFAKWRKIIECLEEKGRQQEEERKQLALEHKINEARDAARAAWENKDYQQVVTIYNSIFPFLTPSEKRKLEYARKHIKTL